MREAGVRDRGGGRRDSENKVNIGRGMRGGGNSLCEFIEESETEHGFAKMKEERADSHIPYWITHQAGKKCSVALQ